MSALRTIIAATALAVAAISGANAGVPAKPPVKPPHTLPLCRAHNEIAFIEGVGKVLYFIDSRCNKHYVRTILS
jgi:hypothetical protein